MPLESIYCQKVGIEFYEKGCMSTNNNQSLKTECDKLHLDYIKCEAKDLQKFKGEDARNITEIIEKKCFTK